MNKKNFYFVSLPKIADTRGELVIAEVGNNIPFLVKRMFFSYGAEKDIVRGEHANRNSKFFMFSVVGSCKVCVDDGYTVEEVVLDEPNKALFMSNMIWKKMYDFSNNCILMVFSDCTFNKDEYIDSYDEYLKEIKTVEEIS